MKVEVRPYTEATYADAAKVVEAGFGGGALAQLKNILCNPARAQGESAGDIVYENGVSVAFQAAVRRTYFNGATRFFATVPGMLVMSAGHSPSHLLSLVEQTVAERFERKLVVANTAIPVSQKLFNLLGVSGQGPASCELIRFSILRLGGFACFSSRQRLPHVISKLIDLPMCLMASLCSCRDVEWCAEIIESEFNDFWCRYQESNTGVVASRTAAELNWLWGDGLRSGTIRLCICRDKQGGIVGYISVKESQSCPGRWVVVDWIAVGNDTQVLARLLRGVKACLLKFCPNAFLLECIGFPAEKSVELRRALPFVRKSQNNSFVYRAYDESIAKSIDSGEGWFFGPMDGDRCM